MDLWIRSQDRERLGTIDRIEYDFDDYGHYLKGWQDKYTGSKIATYKTKERALEVLDEIQSLLLPKLILNSYDNITQEFSENITIMPISTDIKQFNSYVYEMPKE